MCVCRLKIYNSTPPPTKAPPPPEKKNKKKIIQAQHRFIYKRASPPCISQRVAIQLNSTRKKKKKEKKRSHIALWMQKYQSTIYRKVCLTLTLQLRTYSYATHKHKGTCTSVCPHFTHHYHAGSRCSTVQYMNISLQENQNYAPAHENKKVLKYFWDLTLSRRCSVEGHNESLEINYACGIKLKLSKSIILRYCKVKKNKIKEELLQNMPPISF